MQLAKTTGFSRGMVKAVAALARAAAEHRGYVEGLIAEVARRGGETSILHSPSQGSALKRCVRRELECVSWEPGTGLVLLKAEGWRYYSRRFGARPAVIAYLAGRDDNGLFAVRVPGTCTTVDEALDWLTPAEVKTHESIRQGNVYAVRTAQRRQDEILGRHSLCTMADGSKVLFHLPRYDAHGLHCSRCHEPIQIPSSWRGVKLVAQKRMDTPRGRTRD